MTKIKTSIVSRLTAVIATAAAVVSNLFVNVAVADTAYYFTVKGIVKGMPGDGLAANEILVKHQPIPDYRDDSGAIVGMMAMTMPFYLAKGVSLDGIKAGDAVELKVEQHLKPTFTEEITSIKKVE